MMSEARCSLASKLSRSRWKRGVFVKNHCEALVPHEPEQHGGSERTQCAIPAHARSLLELRGELVKTESMALPLRLMRAISDSANSPFGGRIFPSRLSPVRPRGRGGIFSLLLDILRIGLTETLSLRAGGIFFFWRILWFRFQKQ